MNSFTASEIQPVDTPTLTELEIQPVTTPTLTESEIQPMTTQKLFHPSYVRNNTGDQPEQDKPENAALQFNSSTYKHLSMLKDEAVSHQSRAKAIASASTQKVWEISGLSERFSKLSEELPVKESDYTNALKIQHESERKSTMIGAIVKKLSMIPPKNDDDVAKQIEDARKQWGIALEKVKTSTSCTNLARDNLKRVQEELKNLKASIRENCSTSAVVVENLTSACKSFVGAFNMCATWFTKKLESKCKEFNFTETDSEMESGTDTDEKWSVIDTNISEL